MRIRAFSKNIEQNELLPFALKNCNVVIDGQNYFYNLYEKFGIPYTFGSESDKFAAYLRKHLDMFLRSNVTCYIIFKGGHANKSKVMEKQYSPPNYVLQEPNENIVLPVFMKKIYKEVLKELGFKFVACEYESKQQCIALAQKLKCPVISYDVEFCFSGVKYIPISTLVYDDEHNQICCGVFQYERFKENHNLDDEKVAIFIALRDSKIETFPEDFFEPLFKELRFPFSSIKRNERLLQWLRTIRPQGIYNRIYRYLSPQEKNNFQLEVERIMAFICRNESPGVPAEYLLNENQVIVQKKDPKWFEKGVALGNVPISYVNLFRWGVVRGSWSIEDEHQEDAMLLSLDIIAYAQNLMCNYERDELLFLNKNGETESKDISLSNRSTICKPSYVAEVTPFENGWDDIKSLRLFEHFLSQSFQGLDFAHVDVLPDDVKLLMLALVYFSRRKSDSMERQVYSILLSYVMLSVVRENMDEARTKLKYVKKPFIDTFTDKNLVTKADCNVANDILANFFDLPLSELHQIFDGKILHPLVEFQHCLDQMCNLNGLCGKPFVLPLIHKTFNGTFVYKFFYSMRELPEDEAMLYIEKLLSPAPTVLAFLTGLIEVYHKVMFA